MREQTSLGQMNHISFSLGASCGMGGCHFLVSIFCTKSEGFTFVVVGANFYIISAHYVVARMDNII